MKLEQILNDAEKAKVEAFVADKGMAAAVKKVLLFGAQEQGVIRPGVEYDPTTNFALQLAFKADMGQLPISDEELGQNTRASARAIRFVEQAFGIMEQALPKPAKAPKGPQHI